VRGRLGAALGWVGWGRYGLLRYIAGMGGVECGAIGCELRCLEEDAVARYPSKAGLVWLYCVGLGRCRVVRWLGDGTGRLCRWLLSMLGGMVRYQ
jgi:hypothetical protein